MDDYSSYNDMDHFEEYNGLQSTQDTFKAYVDAVIPRTPGLAEEYGRIQYFGALDLYTDEYLIATLNDSYTPLAKQMAELLDLAAEQFLLMEGYNNSLNFLFPAGGAFAALTAADRFRALSYLEQIPGYIRELPEAFEDNPGIIRNINSFLSRYTMLGYYSEWAGYGNTRLNSPNERILEFYPLSWQQIEYPGPSLGYRALRDSTAELSAASGRKAERK